jgi:uncharacterized protein (DUF58 family)
MGPKRKIGGQTMNKKICICVAALIVLLASSAASASEPIITIKPIKSEVFSGEDVKIIIYILNLDLTDRTYFVTYDDMAEVGIHNREYLEVSLGQEEYLIVRFRVKEIGEHKLNFVFFWNESTDGKSLDHVKSSVSFNVVKSPKEIDTPISIQNKASTQKAPGLGIVIGIMAILTTAMFRRMPKRK